jgi:hypothetical protein
MNYKIILLEAILSYTCSKVEGTYSSPATWIRIKHYALLTELYTTNKVYIAADFSVTIISRKAL